MHTCPICERSQPDEAFTLIEGKRKELRLLNMQTAGAAGECRVTGQPVCIECWPKATSVGIMEFEQE